MESRIETKAMYDGRVMEEYEGTEKLTGSEFNDVIGLLKKWIKVNKIKTEDLDYINIKMYVKEYKKTFEFDYRPDNLTSRSLEVKGDEGIGLKEFVDEHNGRL